MAVELIGDNLNPEKEKLMKELDLYHDIRKHSQCDQRKSKRFFKDIGILMLIFSVSLFSYGISYNYWLLDIFGACAVLFSFIFYLTSKNEKVIKPQFMRNTYLISGIFFVLIGLMLISFVVANFSQFDSFKSSILPIIIIPITALITFYCAVEIFMSYINPCMPFNPMKPVDKSMFLSVIIKNRFSIFDFIVAFAAISVIVSITHLFLS